MHRFFDMSEPELFLSYLKNELNYSLNTFGAYERDLNQFIEWLCPGKPERFVAEDITTSDIRSWLAFLSREGKTPRSIRRKAQSLRAFFKFLLKEGRIKINPTSDLLLPKLSKPLPDIIKHTEIETVLHNFEKDNHQECETDEEREDRLRNKLVIEILYSLGLRRAELASINDEDITFSLSEIKVTGKRMKQRIVPLPLKLLESIKEWINLRNSLWHDLPSPTPLLVIKGKRITVSQIYTIVKKELASVNAKKKSPHALRHSFATSMLNEGADLNSVKEFLGHSSLATTQIYTHISFAEIKKAYNSSHPRSQKRNK